MTQLVADTVDIYTLKQIDPVAAGFANDDRALVHGNNTSSGSSSIANSGNTSPLFYYWDSSSSATDDDITVIKPVAVSGNGRWLILASDITKTMTATDATPSVAGCEWLITAGTTAITNFDDGYEGQQLTVQRGGSDIVVTHDPAKINLGGKSITLTADNPTVTLKRVGGIWRSLVSAATADLSNVSDVKSFSVGKFQQTTFYAAPYTDINDVVVLTNNSDGTSANIHYQKLDPSIEVSALSRPIVAVTSEIGSPSDPDGICEFNAWRAYYKVPDTAGPNIQIQVYNAVVELYQDVRDSVVFQGMESSAGVLATTRAMGPMAGDGAVAHGIWGSDVHVEKYPGVADGKVRGLEVGVHMGVSYPADSEFRNVGIDLWSGPRNLITTAYRAGYGLSIAGAAGWATPLSIRDTDDSDLFVVNQYGNLTITTRTVSAILTQQTDANDTSSVVQLVGRTSGGTQVGVFMTGESGGQGTVGTNSDHDLVFQRFGTELGRFNSSNVFTTLDMATHSLVVAQTASTHTVATFTNTVSTYNTDIAFNNHDVTGGALISLRTTGELWLYQPQSVT